MALEEDIHRLARIPLLALCEDDALRLLAFSAEAHALRAGDVIFRAGEDSDAGYFVTSGSVALGPVGEPSGRIVYPDALIGEVALITKSTRPATAIAREPTTVLKISRALFRRVLLEFPHSAARMRQVIAARLQDFAAELNNAPNLKAPDSNVA